MKKMALVLGALATLASCTTKKQAEPETATKTLVLYYSQTNNTKQVAEAFQQKLGADIATFDAATPYDGDFGATIARCQQEMGEGIVPEISELTCDIAAYDTIYLGYPVWFGTYAMPVAGLLKSVDLSGKVIVPFCTFGSGGLNTSSDNLKAALPDSQILPGYGVRTARVAAAQAEVEEFLIRSGVIEGEVEALADFSEQQPVNDEEKAVFDAACGSYSMPLGSPVTCGKRTRSAGTEYLYTCDNNAQIYVIVTEGAEPEFTQVVR